MEEKPRVIISTTRKRELKENFFLFSPNQIREGGLFEFRRKAWDAYNQIPVPSTAEESWRRSDIRSMPVESLNLGDKEAAHNTLGISPKPSKKPRASEVGGRIVVSQNASNTFLSSAQQHQGVLFTDLRTAEIKHLDILQTKIGKIVPPEEGKFAALAAAFSRNGIFLYVPKGITVKTPLNGLLWGQEASKMLLSHIVIWLDEGSTASFILESKSSNKKTPSFLASTMEIIVGEQASLQFIDLQSHGDNTWNFTHARARVERNGSIDWIYGAVGGKFTKSFLNLDLVGTGAQGRMSGFYFLDGSQHLDMDTQQDHHAAHTTSDLLFKGAVKDNSRAVWQGMIYVAQGAQGTDGYQANRNIVLSEGARADSIPGLEILTDDVRCTHGATVSKLEEEPIFYLQSRGIPRRQAEHLLLQGFFEPIMDRIGMPSIRREFSKLIEKKIKR